MEKEKYYLVRSEGEKVIMSGTEYDQLCEIGFTPKILRKATEAERKSLK